MRSRITSRVIAVLMAWLAASALTWYFCPPPNPPFSHPDAPDSTDRLVYPLYCLGFWPVIAYQTLSENR